MKATKEEIVKSNTHQVTSFDIQCNTFNVEEEMNHSEGKPMGRYKDDLLNDWCDRAKFQAFHFHCSHVITACFSVRQNAYVHLSNVYKVVNLFGVYRKHFPVLPYEEYWPIYEGDQNFHNSRMRRIKKCRPKNTHSRTEMDTTDKLEIKCELYRLPGHTRRRFAN